MSNSPLPPVVFPPLDGSLSISDIVDFNIQHNPYQPAFVFSFDDEPDTITEVLHLEFGRATHRAAHIVRPNGYGQMGSVVAVIANLDTFVYQTLVLGIMRAGLVPFPISPRNSPAAVVHLLKVTSCHRIIVTPVTLGSLLDDVQSLISQETPEFGLEVEVAPMIAQLFPSLGKEDAEHPFSPYPPHSRFKPTDICLYLHSSGSTGFPKAIPQRVRSIVEWGASHLSKSRKHEPRLRFGAVALPPFHVVGFMMQVRIPDAYDVRGMVKSLDNVDFLRNFEVVAYGGGPMPKSLGESLVASGINLQSGYGSTEAGSVTVKQLNRDPNLHWEWIEFSEHVTIRWVPQGDGTFEAQFLTTDTYHPSVENLEDTKGYATSDLFVPHPTLERFWRIVGRKDDVIIHSSGEKTVPALMERALTTNSIIQGAVMFGRGHDQAGALLEPVQELAIDIHDQKQVADFRSRAWPIIEEANKDAPAFSKIFKEMILITSSNKPLPRSAKGTIMRKAALELYDEEIEALYQTIESNTAGDHILVPESWDKSPLQAWLLQQAKDILSVVQLNSSQDLFEQGFDSLSATFLRLRIAGALRKAPKRSNHALLQNIVYSHPVINDLAGYVASFFLDSDDVEQAKSHTDAIEAMVEKYSIGLRQSLEQPASVVWQPTKHAVLITGTTGNLGSQVLEQLLRRPDVTRIYAFNRRSELNPTLTRLQSRFKDKGLDAQLLNLPKLTLLEGDLAQERLGLPLDVYTEVQNLVTIVIHVAWRLDFNLTLASFEAAIQGSVSSAQGWDPERGPYPEEIVDDPSAAVGNGYGESKYIAERILVNSGLHATSVRMGQISGGLPNGAWATSDWVPILIKSSLALGALPDAPGTISWLPMDVVAQCILDMVFSSEALPIAVNLVHPRPLSWSRMFSHIRDELLGNLHIEQDSLPLIPFHDWICRLEERKGNMNGDKLHKLPAVKLLDFFRRMAHGNGNLVSNGTHSVGSQRTVTFATDKAQGFSSTLRELGELNAVDFNLQHNSSEPAFIFSADEHPQSTTIVTYLEFGRAIHRAAHLLRPNGTGVHGSVVAIIALSDTIVFQTVVVGLMRAGLVPFPISHRNSPAAIIHLLKNVSCHRILATPVTLQNLMDSIEADINPDFEVVIDDMPTFDQLYPKLGMENMQDHFDFYPPLHKHFNPEDIIFYFHSSGSTGSPKPIPESARAFAEWAANNVSSVINCTPALRVNAMALPAFHIFGFIVQVIYTVYGLICVSVFPPVVWNPEDQPCLPAPNNIFEHLQRTGSNGLFIIPTLLHGIAECPGGIETLRNLELVVYGGGPIGSKLGDLLHASGVNLQPIYGSTETGPTTVMRLRQRNSVHWEWMEFSDRINKRWILQDDGTFELQYLTCPTHHPSVENMEDSKGYASSDTFLQHPTLPQYWRIVGRIDDIIVHSSGEKTVPAPFENILVSHPKASVMFGHKHDQAGVLVEVIIDELPINENDQIDVAGIQNRVWPIVEEASKHLPKYSRVYKEMILIASPDKPLPFTPKGTVMRKAALKLYETEIEALYQSVESNTSSGEIDPPVTWEEKVVVEWLLRQTSDILSSSRLELNEDFFDQGFDSLSATLFRLRIAGALRRLETKAQMPSLQNIVYEYPTIHSLARYLSEIVHEPEKEQVSKSKVDIIEDMVAKYSTDLDKPIWQKTTSNLTKGGHVVLITGTTGNLGSQILEQLLRNEQIERVYALNRRSRSGSAFTRTEQKFNDKGLDAKLLHLNKLVTLDGDAAQTNLGLPMDMYAELQQLVTIIIHVAWKLDFNLTLASFEPNIRGTRSLIDLARGGPHASSVRFIYTSSIASAQAWGADHGLTLKKLWQISGGVPGGVWATSDWVPILVKSILALGEMPDAIGVASWLPMDAAAMSILDIAFSAEPCTEAVNLVHPRPVKWNVIMVHIRSALKKYLNIEEQSMGIIPFSDWVALLESRAKEAEHDYLQNIPAIKLISFLRDMAKADDVIRASGHVSAESGGFAMVATEKAQVRSSALRNLDPLGVADVERWIKYWVDVGFLAKNRCD
ncbi:hypothetical protein BDQ17DRAFT_1427303 [Cyathus striatus]|nr:hypothetical protein BDQ17DRAFT_1427303 [Cyathus striatus]